MSGGTIDFTAGDSPSPPEPAVAVASEKVDPSVDDVAKALESTHIKAEVGGAIELNKGGEIDWENEVLVERNDPNSPIYSKCKDFGELGLEENLLKGLDEMGFHKPSKIQEVTLPMIVKDPPQNVWAQSQSGTGKTGAFCLGMLSRAKAEFNYPQILCIAPTRELAGQIFGVFDKMGKYMKINGVLAVKLDRAKKLPRNYKAEGQVIIGTSGTIKEWINKRIFDPHKIIMLVLDEADDMLETGNTRQQTEAIRDLLKNVKQILLFSATFNEIVSDFAEYIVGKNANRVLLKPKEVTVKKITQYSLDCRNTDRYAVLCDVYDAVTLGKVIIFVNSVAVAQKLAETMKNDSHQVGVIYGKGMEPSDREMIMGKFRDGDCRVLISTNLLARGIDVDQVTAVINYDIPWDPQLRRPDTENYIHRIGRCGRFGKRGIAINFIGDQRSHENLEQIAEDTGSTIIQIPLDDDAYIKHLSLK